MKHLTQPSPKTCGQTCVAMVAGVTVDRVCEMIGTAATYPKDLRGALGKLGWSMDKQHCCKLPEFPKGIAIGFLQAILGYKLIGHFVVCDGSKLLDPCGTIHTSAPSNWTGRFYACQRSA